VDLLRKVFPEMQMVVSTHSPHVLSTVDVDSIRIIRMREGAVVLDTPTFQTRGVESADVLAAIMGVHPVPQVPEAQWLSDYRALVQTGHDDTSDGRQLWGRLLAHFGADHPVILELATLRRLQEFKRMHNLPGRDGG
jgi:predicted ATP-binding protein involved in virulence